MGAQLALLDEGFPRDVTVFDGVFEGHDVSGPVSVDLVDKGGDRG